MLMLLKLVQLIMVTPITDMDGNVIGYEDFTVKQERLIKVPEMNMVADAT